MATIIDKINKEYSDILNFLEETKQISLYNNADENFKKLLVLSIGSYFEHEIQQILIQFVINTTSENKATVEFFKNKAIKRQYHTYFHWRSMDDIKNPERIANSFFSLFGEDFMKSSETDVKEKQSLGESIKAFIELGHIRNILTHSNLASYSFDTKTTNDLYNLYKKALGFINYLKEKLPGSSPKNKQTNTE